MHLFPFRPSHPSIHPPTEPVIDLEQDFGAMRVARLREILAEQGEECVGCAEKADFIAKIRQVAERQRKARA